MGVTLGGQKFNFGLPHQNMDRAANAQDEWINKAADERRKGFNQTYSANKFIYKPYKGLGRNAMKELMGLIKDPSSVQNLPGYDQGIAAIENSAASRGGLLSGNALRDISDYGQNNFMNWLSTYSGLAGQGYGMDRDRLGHLSDVYTSRAASEAQRWGDISNYAKMHENAGMNIAAQWASPSTYMGMFGGGMGGGGQQQSSNSFNAGSVPSYSNWGGGQMQQYGNKWGWT